MEIENGKIVEKKFVIDPEFKDPLMLESPEIFEEIEIEEADYYYKVFLGVPITHKCDTIF